MDLSARVPFIHPTRGTLSDVAGRLMVTAPIPMDWRPGSGCPRGWWPH
ncbi:MAG: hypothetical protein ABR608_14015 [Pseudonocardiaceae bacterium]